jgi:DNA-directed RNA polymerase subunit RPC12/RpoP
MGIDMVRFDFACKKCEKTFTVWSDEAKVCPYCCSKRVFKVFLTPTAYSTGKASRVDNLAERQLDAAGLSNYTNVGGTIRRTRKTDPKELEALAAAKANNLPFDPRQPITTGPAVPRTMPGQIPLAQDIKSRGKGHITPTPKGPGALVEGLMQRGRVVDPLWRRGERINSPSAKEDAAKLNKLLGK